MKIKDNVVVSETLALSHLFDIKVFQILWEYLLEA